jgi:putative ABC transport system permease protein
MDTATLGDTLLRDARYAVRGLLRRPGSSVVAVLTLAVGIGATTAIFSVFDAVLLRPLPYRSADRLYAIHEVGREGNLFPVNALHFREWRAATRSFDDMALIGPETFDLSGAGEPVRVSAARVTPSLFWTVAIEPSLGRPFLEGEDVPSRDRVAILGHELFAVRIAVGAQPGELVRAVVAAGLGPVIAGLLIGLAMAIAASQLMTVLLYGVSPADPVTYIVVVAALTGSALLACVVPVRRVLRLNPVVALRHE